MLLHNSKMMKLCKKTKKYMIRKILLKNFTVFFDCDIINNELALCGRKLAEIIL